MLLNNFVAALSAKSIRPLRICEFIRTRNCEFIRRREKVKTVILQQS